MQRIAKNESVDAATGQLICPVALEFRGIDQAFRVLADLRCDVSVELREQAVEASS